MDIRQLRYFVTVIEEGTITAAARRLHLSQPPLSAQMRLLEEELGVVLFERGARQIKLTDAGILLYQYAREILELEAVAREELGSLRTGQKGIVRIGMISSCDCEELFRGLRRFHERACEVQFKVYEGNTYELLELLKNGKIELAIVRTPFPGHGLEKLLLRRDAMMAVGVSRLLAGEGTPLTVSELAGVPLILYRRWEKIVRDRFEELELEPDIFCINDDARTSLQWAAEGLGVALVPASILRRARGLAAREVKDEMLYSSLVLVRRRGAAMSQSAFSLFRAFQEEMEDR